MCTANNAVTVLRCLLVETSNHSSSFINSPPRLSTVSTLFHLITSANILAAANVNIWGFQEWLNSSIIHSSEILRYTLRLSPHTLFDCVWNRVKSSISYWLIGSAEYAFIRSDGVIILIIIYLLTLIYWISIKITELSISRHCISLPPINHNIQSSFNSINRNV